jgi:kinesin family protein 2/24
MQVKREAAINVMNDEDVLASLKNLSLPTFGTKQERVDRLKKHLGLQTTVEGVRRDSGLKAINKIQQQRDERRAEMNKKRQEKMAKEIENEALGRMGDVEFEGMIDKEKFRVEALAPHAYSQDLKLTVCVRKRPIFQKELMDGEIDCVSVANPEIKIFGAKFKVDGITKCVEANHFAFDNTFGENEGTEVIYEHALQNVIGDIFANGFVTLFAYGQTGSGKTFTMKEIQQIAVEQIFAIHDEMHPATRVFVSFYEIYGGRCFDLLANKAKVQILEDKNNNVVIQGLFEQEVTSDRQLMETIEFAFEQRTTHSTTANDTSSRSHAICQILVKTADDRLLGKFIVVDLAGSERAQDTQSNNRQRRLEGAEINKSLLALKECIRAMDSNSGHIPFRASKLTLSIRDSFISKDFNNRVVMVACLCPGTSSSDHSVNTLRYADRLKGKKLLGTQSNGPQLSNASQIHEIPFPQVLEPKKELQPQKPTNFPQQSGKEIGSPKPLPATSTNDSSKIGQEGSKNPSILVPKVPEAQKKVVRSSSKEAVKLPLVNKPKVVSDANIFVNPTKPFQKKTTDALSSEKLEEATNEEIKRRTNVKKDFEFMKRTLREDSEPLSESPNALVKPKVSEEYFHFHEKVGDIIDLHDELMSVHLNIIREDATLLNQESEILKKSQSDAVDYEIDNYVFEVENIVKKKLHIYKVFYEKIKDFKRALKEEEEISSQVKQTMYY